jgi:hypothetical protein
MTDSEMTARGADNSAPTVSVICRTTGRRELRQALESVASQDYRPLEVVLVDAIGDGLEAYLSWCAGLPVIPVSEGTPLARSVAANRGLDAATGSYLMLLDEDDWIAPRHVTNLVASLESHPDIRAAYSSVRKAAVDGTLLDEEFSQAFDPVLLKRDNYIPIHAMLFEASLVASGCRFDEDLDIYEDWDLWLQLSRLTDFQHVDEMTAFYRQGGYSDTAEPATAPRYNASHAIGLARTRIYDKWMREWTGEELNQLIGLMDANEQLMDQDRQIVELHTLTGTLDERLREITARHDALLLRLEEARSQLEERDGQLHHSQEHVRQLQNRVEEIYGSRSWRLTAPLRKLARLVRKHHS